MANKFSFDEITNHLTLTGFVFPGSQIYGGLSNTWDYGPLGAELKRNIRDAWWKKFVQESPTNVGLDAAILMNPKVWEATGRVPTRLLPLLAQRNRQRPMVQPRQTEKPIKRNGGMPRADQQSRKSLLHEGTVQKGEQSQRQHYTQKRRYPQCVF